MVSGTAVESSGHSLAKLSAFNGIGLPGAPGFLGLLAVAQAFQREAPRRDSN
jgi:hypothetical protein